MKVLITGGAGFIGSHLAENLIGKGDEVFVIDDLSTGSIENIEHLEKREKFHCVIDSIFNKEATAKLVDKCDIIYHLAAAVGVSLVVDSPVKTIEINVKGTEIILELANKKKRKVFIASSSEVYGKSEDLPFSEESDLVMGTPYKRRWAYACSKALDEFLALAYWKEKKLPVVIVRFFNTVGPRQTGRYGMVIPRLVKQALLNQPLSVYGTGRQTRCFAHVKDVVRALIALKDRQDAVGEIINIGNDREISIENLAQKIKKIARSESAIKHVPYEEAYEEGFEDMLRRRPDLTKIKKLLKYKPCYDIDAIIEDVVKYCKRNI